MTINTANQTSDILQYPMNYKFYFVLLMCEYHSNRDSCAIRPGGIECLYCSIYIYNLTTPDFILVS